MNTIRNTKGPSNYFRGVFKQYGNVCWNVKINDSRVDDAMLESIQAYYLGPYVKLNNGRYGFEDISDVVGRDIESSLEGRSGGWLAIHSDITEEEAALIDKYLADCLADLPKFIERQLIFRAQEEAQELKKRETIKVLATDARVKAFVDLIRAYGYQHNSTINICGVDLLRLNEGRESE